MLPGLCCFSLIISQSLSLGQVPYREGAEFCASVPTYTVCTHTTVKQILLIAEPLPYQLSSQDSCVGVQMCSC